MKIRNKINNTFNFTKRVIAGHFLALAVLALVMLVANNILKERSAKQAVSFIKHLVIKNDKREVIHMLSMAEMRDFSGVIYFSDVGARVFSLPADLSDDLISKKSPMFSLTHNYLDIPIYFGNEDTQAKLALVRFIYPRFSLFPYALGLWAFALLLTLPIVQSTKRRLALQSERELKAKTDAYKADIAAKVRHDIRTPLASFKTVLSRKNGRIDMKLITHAATRIEEIISELQTNSPKPNGGLPDTSLEISQVIKNIVAEKEVFLAGNFPNVKLTNNIGKEIFFVRIDEVEFKSTLSNLIDNAIEATDGIGNVHVELKRVDSRIWLEIRDDGVGIEEVDLDRIFEKDFTKGKLKGTGIGLYYAKKLIDEVNGFIEVESRVGIGSVFRVSLPTIDCPTMPATINLRENADVVILDDQESQHSTWRLKFEEFDKLKLHFFKDPDEMIRWHKGSALESPLYLVDYDLGDGHLSGTDVIDTLKIADHAILVTGHADDFRVMAQCSSLSCSLISKDHVSTIPIVVNQI